ncbi:MAG: Tetrahydromethanopterin:alpha-L-glutamate ligase [Promethearchaeota archaeon]|nr:MAG: Tetrahydromethanopterin:alpha-L-glutamate ligase [Candidatus Lokiarchaeota archaeon]
MKKTMIITPKPEDPEVQLLTHELQQRGYEVIHFIPANVRANIYHFHERFEDLNPHAALVRGFGAAATQKIFFRLDLLSAMEELGMRLINSRESLEIASDKFLSSIFLQNHQIPTPETIICEEAEDALKGFEELGGDVILKPLYGSKGIGITRLNDRAFAENVIYALSELNEVFYLQEFVEHNNRDIRVLVLGDRAVAGMYRISDNWKTNIYAGATMEPIELNSELIKLSINAAQAVKTEIAGVDIIESEEGYQVLEVNSIPGFTALQKVTDIDLTKEIIDYFLIHAIE